ncbi:hypothetical protein PIB30_092869 [Stylosanthes scabra]|uniref:Uncharacterized protein n=1 Tax=Stylosanthes scabra TaxID=79078 RepID=A0ABU6QVQ2_9FABA|nr:hypothetical protein [Stylosanthes scabra]
MAEIGKKNEELKRENESCSSFILFELGLQRGLALVRILEIPILAFINFLSDAIVRSRGEEHAGARSALMLVLTFHHAVARVRRVVARCGQNLPEQLPRLRDCLRQKWIPNPNWRKWLTRPQQSPSKLHLSPFNLASFPLT